MQTTESVGLVGLGTMGGAVAVRLLAQGVDVRLFDVDPNAVKRVRAETSRPIEVAKNLEDVARHCSIVLCSLAHPDVLLEVVTGTNGLHQHLQPGSIVVDLSTSGPDVVKRCGSVLEKSDCQMVDITIGRGPAAARRGELVLMLGGAETALERLDHVISALAAKVVRCGALGSAQVIKLANNLVACANLAAIAEAYQIVREHGCDPKLLLDVMSGTYADSFQLQNSVVGKAVKSNFDIVFRLDLAAKDVGLAADAAKAKGMSASVSEGALEWYRAAIEAGAGKLDWSAVMIVADPALTPNREHAR